MKLKRRTESIIATAILVAAILFFSFLIIDLVVFYQPPPIVGRIDLSDVWKYHAPQIKRVIVFNQNNVTLDVQYAPQLTTKYYNLSQTLQINRAFTGGWELANITLTTDMLSDGVFKITNEQFRKDLIASG